MFRKKYMIGQASKINHFCKVISYKWVEMKCPYFYDNKSIIGLLCNTNCTQNRVYKIEFSINGPYLVNVCSYWNFV